MADAAMKHMASNFDKLDKFKGVDFRRWQKKMHFLLSSMSVVYVLTTPMPDDGGDDPTVEQVRKRAKWDNDDYVCRCLILNVSCIIDKLPPSSKDFKHTLKHKKEELTLVELGSHLRIEESLRVQDSDKPKSNNVAGPLVINMKYGKTGHIKRDCKGVNVGNKANGLDTKGSVDGSSNSLKGQNMFNKSLQVYYVTYVSEAYFVQDDDVAWWVDLGAIVHVCKDRCWFKTYESLNDGSILHMGNESTALVHGCGYVDLKFRSRKIVSLFNVLHVPNIRKNLISSSILNNYGYKQVTESNKFVLSKHGVFIGFGYFSNQILGHVHFKRMQDMSKDGLIPTFDMDTEKAVVRLPDPKLKSLGERGIECIFIEYAEHSKAFRFFVIEPNDSDDPKTFDEAMKSQDVAFWKETTNDEIDSIMGNNTWLLAYLPPGCKPLGIYYFDNYAPVTRISTIRLLIAMTSIHNLIIHQMDVKTTFLNGELDEEVYMNQPRGFIMPGNENKVCKLIKSLYGLKQAPKQWHQKFDEVVLSNVYLLNQAEKYVYSKFDETDKGVIICLYVDDMLIFGTDQVLVDLTKEFLSSRFSLKDMGEADVILVSTPMDTSEKLMPNYGQTVSQLEYSRGIGCLMYAMTCTRPDIAFVVGKLSRYTSNPGTQHWQAIRVLEGYIDASWISNTQDNSSTSSCVFLLGGGAISWASKKQTCITSSTMESEFVALEAAGKEAKCAATLAKAYSQMYNGKSRHLGVRHSMILELIMNGVVSIEFVRSQQNLADHLTKRLTRDLVIKSAEGMGLKCLAGDAVGLTYMNYGYFSYLDFFRFICGLAWETPAAMDPFIQDIYHHYQLPHISIIGDDPTDSDLHQLYTSSPTHDTLSLRLPLYRDSPIIPSSSSYALASGSHFPYYSSSEASSDLSIRMLHLILLRDTPLSIIIHSDLPMRLFRGDAIVRVSDEPHLEQDIDLEIQAEIDEWFCYAEAS
ncbi:zinc finger, CCHC-type containing protein [Tanacetum coccineum]|uniref:Zinc finger, CCHC-type containing protein n=1 Tax=Tanacetum coccineum TaxID=301880 RepID=A0ABQ5CVQ5_9ASTR